MKKSVRNLLIMLAVLVVVGGAAALLLLFPASEEEDASSTVSNAERESIIEIEEADVSAVTVENSKGGFTILPADGTEEETTYTIEGLEGYELDTSTLKTCVEDVVSVQAIKGLGEQEGLEKYGLSGERAVKVTIHDKSGGETEITLGDTSQSGTAGQYVLKDGQVYIVPALSEAFAGSSLERVSCVVYSVADSTMPTLDEEGEESETTLPDTLFSMELTGAAFEKPITLEYVEKSRLNGYMLTSPVVAESGTEAFDAMLTSLKSLTANSVAAVGVSGEQLAGYGLDEPDAQVTFQLNDETVTLKASKKGSENTRFLMMEGRDVVYSVENSRVKAWAEVDAMDLRQSTICLANIADVERLTLTKEGDMVYDFTIDLDAEETTVEKPDGGEIAYEDYQGFFKQLISLAVFSLEEPGYGGTPALKVQYQYEKGTSDVLEFYPIEGQDRYACTLNGDFTGQVRGSEMAPLLEALDQVYGS